VAASILEAAPHFYRGVMLSGAVFQAE